MFAGLNKEEWGEVLKDQNEYPAGLAAQSRLFYRRFSPQYAERAASQKVLQSPQLTGIYSNKSLHVVTAQLLWHNLSRAAW